MTPTDAAKTAAAKMMEACLAHDLPTEDTAIFDAVGAMNGSPDPDRTSAETLFILAHVAAQLAIWRSGVNDGRPETVARDLIEEACEELGLYEEEG